MTAWISIYERPTVAHKDRNNDVESLEAVEAARRFPAINLGHSDIHGVEQAIIEIIGNALDEANSGFGDRIDVTLDADNVVSVRDFGRGVPLGWNEKYNAWNYYLIYGKAFAGTKYEDNQDLLRDFNDRKAWHEFKFSDHDNLATVGQHGVGGSATQMTSTFFEVTAYQNGQANFMRFEKGYAALDELETSPTSEPDGTLVRFQPDTTVFQGDIRIRAQWLKKVCFNISLTSGVTVTFTDRDGTLTEYPATTPTEYMNNKGIVSAEGRGFSVTSEDKKILVAEALVTIGPRGESDMNPLFYVNGISVDRGTHVEALTSAFNTFFQNSVSDVRPTREDFEGLLTGIVVVKSNNPLFSGGQSKSEVIGQHVGSAVSKATLELLDRERQRGAEWINSVIEAAKMNASLRAERSQVRAIAREVNKTIKRKKTPPNKFISCEAYERRRYDSVELWISEGDSASGTLRDARDADTQALFPLRGKSLNLFKANLTQLLANREVQDIVQILGAGVDLGAGLGDQFDMFNINDLKVGKVIIMSDADKDGYHIRMLVTLMMWRLFPDLLKRGIVYIAESPIYHLVENGKSRYFYTPKEFEDYRSTHAISKSAHLSRIKGLGEMNAPEFRESSMVEPGRRLIQVKFDPADPEIYDTLEVLFGRSTDRRKMAILASMLGVEGDATEFMSAIEDLDKEALEAEIEDVRDIEVVAY